MRPRKESNLRNRKTNRPRINADERGSEKRISGCGMLRQDGELEGMLATRVEKLIFGGNLNVTGGR
jgi:hypothetical protein